MQIILEKLKLNSNITVINFLGRKNMERRKKFVLAIAIAIVGLMITSVSVIPAKVSTNNPIKDEKNRAYIEKINSNIGCLSIKAESFDFTINSDTSSSIPLEKGVIFDGPGDQTHPGIVLTEGNRIIAAGYHDEIKENLTTSWSTDYGQTWDPGVTGFHNWDYPDGDMWEGNRLIATALCNPNYGFGGISLVLDLVDPADPTSWIEMALPWVDYGWNNQTDVSIACDNFGNTWEFGVLSYIYSTTYGNGYTSAPTTMFADPGMPGYYWINWLEDPYPVYNGSAHTDVDIDRITHQVYSVYDWYNDTSGKWEIILWTFDLTDPLNWSLHIPYLIKGAGNLQYPVVAVNNDNLIILAETDENGNKDIICYYSDDGVNNLQSVFVTDSSNDECYPNVCHISDKSFFSTYIEENNLYGTKTEDGGATWDDTRWQINENDGAVVKGYKTSYLSNNARMAIWEEMHDNVDCYFELLYNNEPGITEIDGPSSGSKEISYNFTFTATDPDNDDISFIVDWGDGIQETAGPFESGVPSIANHTWNEKETYEITAKAVDGFGGEGPEGSFTITIPRNRAVTYTSIYQLIQKYLLTFPIIKNLLGL
jgi:hypothetical protein